LPDEHFLLSGELGVAAQNQGAPVGGGEVHVEHLHGGGDMYRERQRIREQLKCKSEPKQLPFIQPSHLSDDKQDPAQEESGNKTANYAQRLNEGG
jgi:hypothetical protein